MSSTDMNLNSIIIILSLICSFETILCNEESSQQRLPIQLRSVKHMNHAVGVNGFLRGLIENYRKVMRTGLPEMGISVLDPLEIKSLLTLGMNEKKQARIQVNLTECEVKGFSSFLVERLDADLNNSRIYTEIRFPEIMVNGSYRMEGRVIEIVPIRGNGTFWAASKNVTLKATANIHTERKTALKNNSYLQLNSDLNLSMDYDNIQVVDLEGIEGSTTWTVVVKKFLNVTSKELVKRFLLNVKRNLNTALVNSLNSGLRKIPFYIWNSGSEYVDNVLVHISHLVKQTDDPLSMPDFYANFTKEILFTTVTGSVMLQQKMVQGVDNIKRIGEPKSLSNKTHMIINGKLMIEDIRFTYAGWLKFMAFSELVVCKAQIPRITFSFAVIHSNQRESKPRLGDVNIIGKHNVNLEISELGHLEWMTNWLNAGFAEHVDKLLSQSIPAKLANYFRETI